MIQQKTLQVNPLIVLLGVTDHLDLGGHHQKLLQQPVPAEDVEVAVLSLYKAPMTARTELKYYWQRTIVVTGPGYRQLTLALQKVLAGMSLTYRTTEFAIIGGDTPVDENGRPARMDTVRVFAEFSKTIVSMPLLEEAELTVNDAVLREHSEYMKMIETADSNGVKTAPSPAMMHMAETSMRMRGNSVVTRMEDDFVKKSRTSYANIKKVPKKLQENQIHHEDRIPQLPSMPEVPPFDEAQTASTAVVGAPRVSEFCS